MALSPRDRKAIYFGAAVICVGLLARVIVMPAVEHWRGLHATTAEGEARVTSFEQKLQRLDGLTSRQRVRFGPGVDKPLRSVDEVQVTFPHHVQQVLGQGGLGVSSVEPQGTRKLRDVPGVVLVSLRVQCGGGPESLPGALAAIQESDELIIVDSFNLSMQSPGDRDNWSVNMMISTPAIEGGD